MTKHEILKKIRNYTGYLAAFFLIVGTLMAILVDNSIPAAIAFACYSLFFTGNFSFDSHLYYKGLDLEKSKKKMILVSIVFEMFFCILICIQFITGLFIIIPYIYMIIISILIIIFSFCSIFFADLIGDKHNKGIKISICIFYTLFIIIICAIEL